MTERSMLLGLVSLVLAGCATHFSAGTDAYDDGRYPEAQEELVAAEARMAEAAPEARAKYALYRGLNHLALGDAEQAEWWLARAKACWDADRHVLGDEDSGRLLSAWQAMGHAAGEWGADELRRRGAW